MSPHDKLMQAQRWRGDIARLATTAIKKVVTKTPTCRIPRERHGTRGVLLSAVYYSVETALWRFKPSWILR